MGCISVSLYAVNLKLDLVSGSVTVGVRPTVPVQGVSLLLGNNLASDKVVVNPIVSLEPCVQEDSQEQVESDVFPSCAVTRAMSKISEETSNQTTKENDLVDIETTFLATLKDPLIHKKLIEEQTKDPDTMRLASKILPLEEVNKVPISFYMKDGVLMRKWRPPDVPVVDDWIVVPRPYQREVISLSHDTPWLVI